MKTLFNIIICSVFLLLAGCQDKSITREDMKLSPIAPELLKGELVGEDYVWTWPMQKNLKMEVTLYAGGAKKEQVIVDSNSYVHKGFASNIEYTYVFKLTDGTNFSTGVIRTFKYDAPDRIKGLILKQIDNENDISLQVSWKYISGLDKITISATDGINQIREDIDGSLSQYIIPGVKLNSTWNVTVTGTNSKGTSFPVSEGITIGKTAIGFLSTYSTDAELLEKGDDDEASAWLWLKQHYPSATYLYMGSLKSVDQLERFRVLFWIRDVETTTGEDAVWDMPAPAQAAVDVIKAYYKSGGNLLLWGHAVPYIATLGRLNIELLKKNDHVFGFAKGNYNPDPWSLAVELYPGKRYKIDLSEHPIYMDLEKSSTPDTKLIRFISPGWKEDHNCVFFNIPKALTEIDNQERSCYDKLTQDFGIYPLGVWDSQIEWISQLNIWEARQGNTDYKGTVVCIGNGGCEFSMNNSDGTKDVSASPKNNLFQSNVLKLASNCIEYLKTK